MGCATNEHGVEWHNNSNMRRFVFSVLFSLFLIHSAFLDYFFFRFVFRFLAQAIYCISMNYEYVYAAQVSDKRRSYDMQAFIQDSDAHTENTIPKIKNGKLLHFNLFHFFCCLLDFSV